MKKHKFIIPITASASLVALVPALATVVVKAGNISKQTMYEARKSSSTNASDTINIDVTDISVPARKFFASTAQEVTWTGGTAETGPGLSKITTIGNSAFANCSNLTYYTVPKLVTSIENLAFFNCKKLTNINFSLMQENMLKQTFKLGDHAFKDAGTSEENNGFIFANPNHGSSMNEVVVAYLKAMVAHTGANKQWNASMLSTDGTSFVNITNQYKTIPVQLMEFSGTEFNGFKKAVTSNLGSYDSIIFPGWMTGMTDAGLKALEEIKSSEFIKTVSFVPADTTSDAVLDTIKADWFQNWTKLEKVILPANIKTIEKDAFSYCLNLQTLDMSEMTMEELPKDMCCGSGGNNAGLAVSLPKNITTINIDSFSGSNIRGIEIPSTCTTINETAFFGCNTLESIYIPKTVTSIGKSAFEGCSKLTSLNFEAGSKLTSIGPNAFDGCNKLTGTLTLPGSLFASSENAQNIGAKAFGCSGNNIDTIDLSGLTVNQAKNVNFGSKASSTNVFEGWPSRGLVKMNPGWDSSVKKIVLDALHNGGLSDSWVETVEGTENCCQIVYNGKISLTVNPGSLNEERGPEDLQYSYDGKNWNKLPVADPRAGAIKNVLEGTSGTLFLRGRNSNGFSQINPEDPEKHKHTQLGSLCFAIEDESDADAGVDIKGNVMGLLDLGAGTITTLPNAYCFDKLFLNSTAIRTVSKTFLPASVATEGCYRAMFCGCTGLLTTPNLPAETLGNYCYHNMFNGCTGLGTSSNSTYQSVPALPSKALKEGCYMNMFNGCEGITLATDMPTDATLAESCCQNMFSSCGNLQIAPAIPQTALAKNCFNAMFSGCEKLTIAESKLAGYIPQTNTVEGCYMQMFMGCKALTQTPRINATTSSTYGDNAFKQMFEGCTGLTKMECHFRTWPNDTITTTYTDSWVKDLTPGGTFVCYNALPHTDTYKNIHQIPIGWNVEEIDPLPDPYTEIHQEIGATCDKKTNFKLKNYGTNAIAYSSKHPEGTKPDLRYKLANESKVDQGEWTSVYGTDGNPKTIEIPTGWTIYFKGVNKQWSHAPSTGSTWSENYSTLLFTNPDGYSAGSTGVHVFGNCMSLILKSITKDTEGHDVNNYVSDAEWKQTLTTSPNYYNYCFYGLFYGKDEGATEAKKNNYTDHNYCIEDVIKTFFSIPSLTRGIFARTFAICPNLVQSANIYSRESAGNRALKRFCFADTYNGCANLVTPPEVNIDKIPSYDDGFWSFHGTFIDCTKLQSTPQIKITDISNCLGGYTGSVYGPGGSSPTSGNSQTWQWCYGQNAALKEVYFYGTKYTNISKANWSNTMACWITKSGTNYSNSSAKPRLYMDKQLYQWIIQQYGNDSMKYAYYQGEGKNLQRDNDYKVTGCDAYYGNLPFYDTGGTSLKWDIYNIDNISEKLN